MRHVRVLEKIHVQWEQGVPDAEGWWLLLFEADSSPCLRHVKLSKDPNRRVSDSVTEQLHLLDDRGEVSVLARLFKGRVGGMITVPGEAE